MKEVNCRECGTPLQRKRVHPSGVLCNACKCRHKRQGEATAANPNLARRQARGPTECVLGGCRRAVKARGLCRGHYVSQLAQEWAEAS